MGVDLVNEFRPVPEIKRNDKRLIFVGRLVEKKGVSVLLEAMAQVIKTVPDAELLIVGDGPLRNKLEQKAKELGLGDHVQFLGSVPHHQLPELYSSAGIAVVPSIIDSSGDQEGLGLVIVEAIGCGCAVIASNLEAIRDIVNKETGLLAKPADSLDLAENIKKLLIDRKIQEQLSVDGRKRVMEKFDISAAGQRYYNLICLHQE
jgi:glycosyltransferase involved in cell wall biosynthesis